MSGIRISKKHGANPSISTCAWCGKEKGEIVLLGYIEGDVQAPRNIIVNYDPCDECKKSWSQGVAVIEVVRTPNNIDQLPIAKDAYPTGRMVVIKETALKGDYHAGDTVLILQEDFDLMFGPDL